MAKLRLSDPSKSFGAVNFLTSDLGVKEAGPGTGLARLPVENNKLTGQANSTQLVSPRML